MKLSAPKIHPAAAKAVKYIIGYPLLAFIWTTITLPALILISPLLAKRKLVGPNDRWRKCFAWHPVRVRIPRDPTIPFHRPFEWRWLEFLEFRANSLWLDPDYRRIGDTEAWGDD